MFKFMKDFINNLRSKSMPGVGVGAYYSGGLADSSYVYSPSNSGKNLQLHLKDSVGVRMAMGDTSTVVDTGRDAKGRFTKKVK